MMSSKHIKCIKFNALYFLVLNKKHRQEFYSRAKLWKIRKNKKELDSIKYKFWKSDENGMKRIQHLQY